MNRLNKNSEHPKHKFKLMDKKIITILRSKNVLPTTVEDSCILIGVLFSYFSIKTYVVGSQKNNFNETILLSTQNTCYN